jgi:hypothetical protein
MAADTRRTLRVSIISIVWYVYKLPATRTVLMSEQNLLRKSLAWNFDYYQKQGLGPFSNDANILKHHVSKYDPPIQPNMCSSYCIQHIASTSCDSN